MSDVQKTDAHHEIEPREKQEVQRERTRPGWSFRPDVDIVEQADAYLVTADLPGTDEQHVDVNLERGVLSIDADPAFEVDPSWTCLHREYQEGGYHREFSLTDRVDTAGITATLRDGVLELRLPKLDQHRPRSITVQTVR